MCNNNIIAFWKYDQYPYCLSGTVESFKGDLVKIKEYRSYFKPIKIMDHNSGKELVLKLSALEKEYNSALKLLKEEYNRKLDEIAPFVRKAK